MSVNGVAAVEVSLEKGVAAVKLKPETRSRSSNYRMRSRRNGFTMKQSHIIAAGKVFGWQRRKSSDLRIKRNTRPVRNRI
jgi:hypothetical protein